eukprot:TRINITY_DN7388_c0_g1_i7.p2 TRINITY_DN7388_c0_g1~~TRINITY_DN7388_c0_g1_i7.p2  ORF type:complete len:163 (-),score=32.21 TRINITY_DN7388_c0_g1_i7:174-662(-)
MRLKILENIIDEHGSGDIRESHPVTFKELLSAFNVERDPKIPIHVLSFNQAIMGICTHDDVHVGCAALGSIEYLYIGISSNIAKKILCWLPPGTQRHYSIHEVLDVKHAADLFEVSNFFISTFEQKLEAIDGILLGAHLFWNLYVGLHGRVEGSVVKGKDWE